MAAIVVEDDTINLCEDCYNLRLAERKEKVTNARWKAMIGKKSSRGKLSTASGSDGFVKRKWRRYAVNKLWVKDLMDEATKVSGVWEQLARRVTVQGGGGAVACKW